MASAKHTRRPRGFAYGGNVVGSDITPVVANTSLPAVSSMGPAAQTRAAAAGSAGAGAAEASGERDTSDQQALDAETAEAQANVDSGAPGLAKGGVVSKRIVVGRIPPSRVLYGSRKEVHRG